LRTDCFHDAELRVDCSGEIVEIGLENDIAAAATMINATGWRR
jgi:hypothetical protein